jgi:cytochrome c peroxidase
MRFPRFRRLGRKLGNLQPAAAPLTMTSAHREEENARIAPRLGLLTGLALLMASAAIAGKLAAQQINGEPITPLSREAPSGLDRGKVDLGKQLFHDPRLSRNGNMSCASCHDLDRGGADDRPRSVGGDGNLLDYNAPTVFNAGDNFRLNWRGNYRTFEEQNEAVLLDPRLMSAAWPELLARLRADSGYQGKFEALYASPPQREHVLDSLAAFQRSLVTPDAPFDRYLRGEREAIAPEAERGYRLFKDYGCTACHQGVNVGGNLFQQFGVFHNPFAKRTTISEPDLGRFTVTGKASDRHVFRVPSLRNVAVTAPYFHDGSAASLAEAVETMARSQLGRELSGEDIDLIVRFLGTLTGTYQGRPLSARSDGKRP